jgi:peptidoglycan/xylan/chitin deacetylase (PgdA/CDA1 family)
MRRLWRPAALGSALLLALLLGAALFRVSRARCFTLVGSVTCRVETTKPMVALTFDDGPDDAGVEAALAALGKHRVSATFFLIGATAAKRPELVRRLVAAGQEIGNHSWSHARMVLKSAAFYDAEIGRTDAALRAAGAPPPRLFRPPYGKKLIGLPLAVRRHGYRMVTWDVEDPQDGRGDARSYAAHIVRSARPGSIILMHLMYGNRRAREALPLVLDGLERRGLAVVPVGRLLKEA